MDLEQALELIKQKESDIIEFKSRMGGDAYHSIGAYANKVGGGYVFIGVNDYGEVIGTTIGSETIPTWVNHISNITEQRVIPLITPLQYNGKIFAVVEVKESNFKPVAVEGICYKKLYKSTQRMSVQEISEMFLQSIGRSPDSIIIPQTSIDDIDMDRVKSYIGQIRESGRRSSIDVDPSVSLKKLGLLNGESPTLASIVLFGKSPIQKLPYAKVHCGRFDTDGNIIDSQYIESSIIEQVNEVLGFIRKHVNVGYSVGEKPERIETWDYPFKAIREVIINAICHRDYHHPVEISLKIYNDKLVIWNPGRLMPGLTIDDLYNPLHESKPRNLLIANFFYDLGLIEKYGSGTGNVIARCKERRMPKPIFEEKSQGFQVTFYKELYKKDQLREIGLNERQINAVNYLKEYGAITNSIYQEINGVTMNIATSELTSLIVNGIIARIGTRGRGTYYILIGY